MSVIESRKIAGGKQMTQGGRDTWHELRGYNMDM